MISGLNKSSVCGCVVSIGVLITMHDNVKGHAVAPALGESGKRDVIAFHVLLSPLQQCFLCRQPLFIVIALYYDFFDLISIALFNV